MATGNIQETGHRDEVRKYLVPAGLLLLVIGVSALLFIYRDAVSTLGNWGYLGAFLIGLAANATVVFPMPGLLILFTLGATFNPVFVGVAGAAGGAIGELSGYLAGHSSKKLLGSNKTMRRAEVWMKRWGAAGIFLFALVPFLPMDVAGLAAGALRYPVWKFLLASFAGKTLLYVGFSFAAAWGWDAINGWFG